MSSAEFKRPLLGQALQRAAEPRRRIQVLAGPRQVGKTTLAFQLLDALDLPSHYATADDPALRDRGWLEAQWELGRAQARQSDSGAILVLDEIQKLTEWSEIVKRLWDEDTRSNTELRVVLLGSAPLLIEQGLSESLTGRFELIRVPHWSYAEMRTAFGLSLDEYVYFGGYPGAIDLIADRERWSAYIRDSIVETTISRDVLLLTRIDKPALLRGLFRAACEQSGQVVSYQKLLGQLQDAGNTTTLAHYLDLLAAAGMVTGLERYSGSKVRRRRSTPKLLALNTALVSAWLGVPLDELKATGEAWGRLVETAVGAHLVNTAPGDAEVYYWRARSREVDFVVERGSALTALEVKSGRGTSEQPGFDAFERAHGPSRKLLVGGDGIPIEDFLGRPAAHWVA